MKIGVVGSRDFPCLNKVTLFINLLPVTTTIVSGGARGVDRTAELTARTRHQEVIVLKADWEHLGRGAGYARNLDIVEQSDVIVAFWDGVSKGTKHTIDIAKSAGKPVLVISPDSCKQRSIPFYLPDGRINKEYVDLLKGENASC